MPEPVTLSIDEVAKHNKPTDLWVIESGNVYDVTRFVEKHPGGSKVLSKHGGEDVTRLMGEKPHKHSDTAYGLLRKYYVGRLDEQLLPEDLDEHGRPRRRGQLIDGTDEQVRRLRDWENDELIDWAKPLFWQVGHLGDHYWQWCHTPVDRHIRLFYSDFCEFFSGAPWWLIPIVWLPLVGLLLWRGVRLLQHEPFAVAGLTLTPLGSPAVVLAGYMLWQVLEYIIHRWIFHYRPTGYYAITFHFLMHGQHHKDPLNKSRLVFPPVPAMVFAVPIVGTGMAVLPQPVACLVLSGVALGYISYDLTHYYLHHGSPFCAVLAYMKRYHMLHHFHDPSLGFGITTPLMDYPFGTQLYPNLATLKAQ